MTTMLISTVLTFILIAAVALVLWANVDAFRRRLTLWQWRRACARQRLRCDVSRLTRGRRAA